MRGQPAFEPRPAHTARQSGRSGARASRVLNNKRPVGASSRTSTRYSKEFDDIEPRLPWILNRIDTLALYIGLLLKHIDGVLLYAEVDDHEAGEDCNSVRYLLPDLEACPC